MISGEERELIRRAYFIDHKSLRQIARELHVARKTIGRALASAEAKSYKLSTARPAPVLGSYKPQIEELLAENKGLPAKQRYTSHRIYEELVLRGYQGGESAVRGYFGQCRRKQRRPQVCLPLEFDPGS